MVVETHLSWVWELGQGPQEVTGVSGGQSAQRPWGGSLWRRYGCPEPMRSYH